MRAGVVVLALASCVDPAPPIEPQLTSHVARMVFGQAPPTGVDADLPSHTSYGIPCWELAPLDLEPEIPGDQLECSAYVTNRPYGDDAGAVISECTATPSSPCWRIVAEPVCGPGIALTTRLEPGSVALPRDVGGVIECVVAAPSGQNL